MTTEKKFKTGDVVTLKSGGDKMTVGKYLNPSTSAFDDLIECFHINNGKIVSINLREPMLMLVEENNTGNTVAI